MSEWVAVGSFCPNPECSDYGKVELGNIIRYGKSNEGRQRFQCKRCRKTFKERTGTRFYNRKTEAKDSLACLALLAEGTRISSIHRAQGIQEATLRWFLREAAQPAEQVEALLLNAYRISRAEIDRLWTDVGRKPEKKSE
jgi:transposase-like protein